MKGIRARIHKRDARIRVRDASTKGVDACPSWMRVPPKGVDARIHWMGAPPKGVDACPYWMGACPSRGTQGLSWMGARMPWMRASIHDGHTSPKGVDARIHRMRSSPSDVNAPPRHVGPFLSLLRAFVNDVVPSLSLLRPSVKRVDTCLRVTKVAFRARGATIHGRNTGSRVRSGGLRVKNARIEDVRGSLRVRAATLRTRVAPRPRIDERVPTMHGSHAHVSPVRQALASTMRVSLASSGPERGAGRRRGAARWRFDGPSVRPKRAAPYGSDTCRNKGAAPDKRTATNPPPNRCERLQQNRLGTLRRADFFYG
jgi:hypothetical protein